MLPATLLVLAVGAMLGVTSRVSGRHRGYDALQDKSNVIEVAVPSSLPTTTGHSPPPSSFSSSSSSSSLPPEAEAPSGAVPPPVFAVDRGPTRLETEPTDLSLSNSAIHLGKKQRSRLLKVLASRNISCAFVYLRTIDANGTQYYDTEERFHDVKLKVVNRFGGPTDNQDDGGGGGGGGEEEGEEKEKGEEDASGEDADANNVYDHQGAMYFAVAVISIYGLSIALLIASSVRRSGVDYELKGFIRSFAKLDPTAPRPRDKSKIQRALLESGMLIKLTAQGLPRRVLPRMIVCAEEPGRPPTTSAIVPSQSTHLVEATVCRSSMRPPGEEARGSSECSLESESGGDNDSSGPSADSPSLPATADPGQDPACRKPPHPPPPHRKGRGSFSLDGASKSFRYVLMYLGKDKGSSGSSSVDVRASDVALDIPENAEL